MTDFISTDAPVPFELAAINAEQAARLLGCKPRTVLEVHACKPGFPARVSYRPATWEAAEILAYRETLKAGQRGRRR